MTEMIARQEDNIQADEQPEVLVDVQSNPYESAPEGVRGLLINGTAYGEKLTQLQQDFNTLTRQRAYLDDKKQQIITKLDEIKVHLQATIDNRAQCEEEIKTVTNLILEMYQNNNPNMEELNQKNKEYHSQIVANKTEMNRLDFTHAYLTDQIADFSSRLDEINTYEQKELNEYTHRILAALGVAALAADSLGSIAPLKDLPESITQPIPEDTYIHDTDSGSLVRDIENQQPMATTTISYTPEIIEPIIPDKDELRPAGPLPLSRPSRFKRNQRK